MRATLLRSMYGLLAVLCFAIPARPQSYPTPYPRQNARSVLQNDRVNVWEVTWPKGQPTAMHEHPFDQLSITLSGGSVRVTKPGKEPAIGQSTLASIALTPKGTVHMEEGISDVPQHKVMLEIKPYSQPPLTPTAGLPPAFPRDGAAKLMETESFIAWDYTWKSGQTVPRHQELFDSVTVFVVGGTIQYSGAREIAVSAGDVIYTGRRAEASSEEAAQGSPRAVIVELK